MKKLRIIYFFFASLLTYQAFSQNLENLFVNPPNSARPQTWWHWMNGNVTQEGIKADLEALKNIGVGGAQILEIGASIPQGPVGTHDSLQMVMYKTAFEKANELGLELSIHNCPGWSSSGGPWVEPKDAMKQLVWTEKVVAGNGDKQVIQLPQPYTKLGFYRDSYVLAFPTLKGEEFPAGKLAQIISNGKELEQQKVSDGDWTSIYEITQGNDGEKGYIQYNFEKPFTARSLLVVPAIPKHKAASGILQFSNDGKLFNDVTSFTIESWRSLEALACVSFNAVTARYFRIVFNQETIVREVELLAGPRIHNFPEKAGYIRKKDPKMDFNRKISSEYLINPEDIIDLSSGMLQDGSLEWKVPPGNWTIVRFGFTATGQRNIVPPISGEGLEIDKLSTKAVDVHFDSMFGSVEQKLGPVLGKELNRVFIDSYEVGMQNWTDNLPDEFKSRKGYDLSKYMLVLTGRIVKDVNTSEKFLWDFRRNLADMFADNYVGHFHTRCKEKGLQLSIEPYGDGPFDDFQTGSRADIPMGEFWARLTHDLQRTKLPAMVAHGYGMRVQGNQVVEAESFTGAPEWTSWKSTPYSMKALGDLVLCQGVTRYVFHTYAHQPHLTAAPGMTMGQWGFHFDRNNNWFDKAGPWITYISRCQYLLQQGNFVADLCYFAGENSKVECLRPNELNPSPPSGYDYDIANEEVLTTRMNVAGGKIALPDGVGYRLLIFPENGKLMSFSVLKHLQKLISDGAKVICEKPDMSPSLADETKINANEYKVLVDDIWGDIDGKTVTEHSYGKGVIYFGKPIMEILEEQNVRADFTYKSKNTDAAINYIHRKIGDTDIYFIANRKRRSEQLIGNFRITGKQPEFWNPESGTIETAAHYSVEKENTKVAIDLDEAGSVFVVFRKPAVDSPLALLTNFNDSALTDFSGIENNFTLSFWIKPETNMKTLNESLSKSTDDFALSAVIYPPKGDLLYGKNHAACGVAAGINGVAVIEHDSGSLLPVLVAPLKIEGWTHIAIVYVNGEPSLYVNGKFVKNGLKSGKTVHPGISYPHERYDIPYFEGDATQPELIPQALTEKEIKFVFEKGLPEPEIPQLKLTVSGKQLEAEIFENGNYTNLFSGQRQSINVTGIPVPLNLKNNWKVSFSSSAQVPEEMVFDSLISWIDSNNEALKYFSGTATYSRSFNVNEQMLRENQKLLLDLGRVEILASIKVNGKDVGTLWKPPYRADVTNYVKYGRNTIEIAVTNLWNNRLIGDATKPTDITYGASGNILELPQWYIEGKEMPRGDRSTFTTWKHYQGDEALLESGLLGPVKLYFSRIITLN